MTPLELTAKYVTFADDIYTSVILVCAGNVEYCFVGINGFVVLSINQQTIYPTLNCVEDA